LENEEWFVPLGPDQETQGYRVRILIPFDEDVHESAQQEYISSAHVRSATQHNEEMTERHQAQEFTLGLSETRMVFDGTALPTLPRYAGPVLVEVTAIKDVPRPLWPQWVPLTPRCDGTMRYMVDHQTVVDKMEVTYMRQSPAGSEEVTEAMRWTARAVASASDKDLAAHGSGWYVVSKEGMLGRVRPVRPTRLWYKFLHALCGPNDTFTFTASPAGISFERPSTEGLFWETRTQLDHAVHVQLKNRQCIWQVRDTLKDEVWFEPLGLEQMAQGRRARILVPVSALSPTQRVYIPADQVQSAKWKEMTERSQALGFPLGLSTTHLTFDNTEPSQFPQYAGPVLVEITAIGDVPRPLWPMWVSDRLRQQGTLRYRIETRDVVNDMEIAVMTHNPAGGVHVTEAERWAAPADNWSLAELAAFPPGWYVVPRSHGDSSALVRVQPATPSSASGASGKAANQSVRVRQHGVAASVAALATLLAVYMHFRPRAPGPAAARRRLQRRHGLLGAADVRDALEASGGTIPARVVQQGRGPVLDWLAAETPSVARLADLAQTALTAAKQGASAADRGRARHTAAAAAGMVVVVPSGLRSRTDWLAAFPAALESPTRARVRAGAQSKAIG
jgi:hypothetical protein